MGERFTSTVLSIQCGPDERSTVHGPNLPKSDLFISCRTHYLKVAWNHHIVTFSSPRIDGQWARQPNPHGVETDPGRRSKYGEMGFVGWIGASGSVMQWHPELRMGFGYAPTLSHFLDFDAKKAERLQRAVIECIKNIKK